MSERVVSFSKKALNQNPQFACPKLTVTKVTASLEDNFLIHACSLSSGCANLHQPTHFKSRKNIFFTSGMVWLLNHIYFLEILCRPQEHRYRIQKMMVGFLDHLLTIKIGLKLAKLRGFRLF